MGRGLAAERACQATAVAADQQLRSEAIEVAWRAARVGRRAGAMGLTRTGLTRTRS